ncbi:MAG: hypothetical protein QM764_09680 [Chitinophagaceae bacterium]
MKKTALLLTGIAIACACVNAQKKVASYPFEFNKGFLAKKNYESFFLPEPANKYFILVLRDNEKADYILYNDELKKLTSFSPADGLKSTVFNFDDQEYLGGTAARGIFHFVYKVTDKRFLGKRIYYYVENVDPVNKTVSSRELFTIPEEEKLMISFGNFGEYYSITANDETNELVFYGINSAGESFVKRVKIAVPVTAKKKRLSDYLDDIKLFTIGKDEDPELESATEKVKIFHSPQRLTIVTNEDDDPTQVIMVNTSDYSVTQKSIDHSPLTKDEKGQSYVNSFLFDNNIYSLVLNKKNIRIAIYNATTGQLLKTHEINTETDMNTFAEAPVTETRTGNRLADEKDVDNIKKLIKALDKGTEAIMLNKERNGNVVMTIGTYDKIKVHSGGSGPTYYQQSYYSSAPDPSGYNTRVGNMYEVSKTVYVPGNPVSMRYGANFYKSTHFKLLVDPRTLNLINGGTVSSPLNDMIKDYMNRVGRKAYACNQFMIGGKEYFGYYNRDEKIYYIEEIFLKKN